MRAHLASLLLVLSVAGCTDRAADPIDAGHDAAEPAPDDAGSADAGVDAMTRAADAGLDAARDAGPADPEATIRRVACEPLADAACTVPADCDCGGPTSVADPVLCRDRAVVACLFDYADRIEAVRGGRVVIDEAMLAEAVGRELMRVRACRARNGQLKDAYRRVFQEAIALGAPCSTDELCAGGAGACDGTRCVALPEIGAACGGLCEWGAECVGERCVAWRMEGATCERDNECAWGLECIGERCLARAAVGEACSEDEACDVGLVCMDARCARPARTACAVEADCGSLSSCYSTTYDGRCRAVRAAGETCTEDAACVDGLYCDGSARGEGTCAPVPSVGEPCSTRCAAGYVCSADTLHCAAAGRSGEACRAATEGNGCAAGLGCFGGVCGAYPGIGGRCDDRGACAAELTCDAAAGSCVRRSLAGESCTGVGSCAAGLVCSDPEGDGIPNCRTAPVEGEACAGECGPGLLCRGEAIGGACEPLVCSGVSYWERP